MQNHSEVGGDSSQEQISKPILLGLTTAIIIGIIAPLVTPRITHPTMVYHIILHLASVTVASFLSVVSLLAYGRVRTTRVLLMTIGFMALTTSELLYFLDIIGIITSMHIPGINAELNHVIMLAMLGLFGLGVLRSGSSSGDRGTRQ